MMERKERLYATQPFLPDTIPDAVTAAIMLRIKNSPLYLDSPLQSRSAYEDIEKEVGPFPPFDADSQTIKDWVENVGLWLDEKFGTNFGKIWREMNTPGLSFSPWRFHGIRTQCPIYKSFSDILENDSTYLTAVGYYDSLDKQIHDHSPMPQDTSGWCSGFVDENEDTDIEI